MLQKTFYPEPTLASRLAFGFSCGFSLVLWPLHCFGPGFAWGSIISGWLMIKNMIIANITVPMVLLYPRPTAVSATIAANTSTKSFFSLPAPTYVNRAWKSNRTTPSNLFRGKSTRNPKNRKTKRAAGKALWMKNYNSKTYES